MIVGVTLHLSLNERHNRGNTVVRGALMGFWLSFVIGPYFCTFAPLLVRGVRFHMIYLSVIPTGLIVGAVAASIPINSKGDHLGLLSVAAIADQVPWIIMAGLINTRMYRSEEHKKLDQMFGPPTMAVFLMFVSCVICYVETIKQTSNGMVGWLLPLGAGLTEHGGTFLLKRCFRRHYFEPKTKFIRETRSFIAKSQDQLANEETSELQKTKSSAEPEQPSFPSPPLFGDLEVVFGGTMALFALLIENVKFAASIAEVVKKPESTAWVFGMALSVLFEVLKRTGFWYRGMRATLRSLGWNENRANVNALKGVFLRSQQGCGYATFAIVLGIGTLRAIIFSDVRAIIWLDVNNMVPIVLAAEFGCELFEDLVVWGLHRFWRVEPYVNSTESEEELELNVINPIRDGNCRDLNLQLYVLVFCNGCSIVLLLFLYLLGPVFVLGICPGHSEHNTEALQWTAANLGVQRVVCH